MTLAIFLTEAGLDTYSAPLAALGYDNLQTVRGLDANDLATMCSSVNMLPGHVATLKARLTLSAADPAPEGSPVTAPAEVIEKMTQTFEAKLKKTDAAGTLKLGNLFTTYESPKDSSKMIIFLGSINGKKKFRCLCNTTKIFDAGDHFQNAENHLAGRDHFFAFRQHAFDAKDKDWNAWLKFAVGNPKSQRFLTTTQNKKRKQITEANRGFALDPGSPMPAPPSMHQMPPSMHQVPPVPVEATLAKEATPHGATAPEDDVAFYAARAAAFQEASDDENDVAQQN